MASYNYTYPSDFSSGLNESQLHEQVATSSIVPVCTSICRNDTIVSVNFISELSAGEQITLDNLISNHAPAPDIISLKADSFGINNPIRKLERWDVSSLSINTELTDVIGLSIESGLLNNMNTNGQFIPDSDGIYFFTISAHLNAGSNTSITIRAYNNELPIYGTETLLNGDSWAFLGNGGYFKSSDSITFKMAVNISPADADISIKVLKMFG